MEADAARARLAGDDLLRSLSGRGYACPVKKRMDRGESEARRPRGLARLARSVDKHEVKPILTTEGTEDFRFTM